MVRRNRGRKRELIADSDKENASPMGFSGENNGILEIQSLSTASTLPLVPPPSQDLFSPVNSVANNTERLDESVLQAQYQSSSSKSFRRLSSEDKEIFSDSQKSEELFSSAGPRETLVNWPPGSGLTLMEEEIIDITSSQGSESSHNSELELLASDSKILSAYLALGDSDNADEDTSTTSSESPTPPILNLSPGGTLVTGTRKRKMKQPSIENYMKLQKRIHVRQKEIDRIKAEIELEQPKYCMRKEKFQHSVTQKISAMTTFLQSPASSSKNPLPPLDKKDNKNVENVMTMIPSEQDCDCLCFCSASEETLTTLKKEKLVKWLKSPVNTVENWLESVQKMEKELIEPNPSTGENFDIKAYIEANRGSDGGEPGQKEMAGSSKLVTLSKNIVQTEAGKDAENEETSSVSPMPQLEVSDQVKSLLEQGHSQIILETKTSTSEPEPEPSNTPENDDQNLITLSDLIKNIDSTLNAGVQPEPLEEVSQLLTVKLELPERNEVNEICTSNEPSSVQQKVEYFEESESSQQNSESMLAGCDKGILPSFSADGEEISSSPSSGNSNPIQSQLSQLSVLIQVSKVPSDHCSSDESDPQLSSSSMKTLLMANNELDVIDVSISSSPMLMGDDSQSTQTSPSIIDQFRFISQDY